MDIGTSASILSALNSGSGSLVNGIAQISMQHAAMANQLLIQMYALKMSMDTEQAATLSLIQQALGIGQNLDFLV
ncbi:hypothetical protein HZA56_00430 [Candidatus Poribacteria bacterium]|nr:hypothetical protein [Candidatus Poribacteria bacterium]